MPESPSWPARAGAIVAVCFAVAAVLGFGLWWPRHQSNRLLGAVGSLRFSQSTQADLQRILGPPAQLQGSDCAHNACTLIWIANNRLMSALHLAPPTAVNVGVVLMGGTTQAIWESLASRDRLGKLHGAMLTLETEPNLVPNAPVSGSGAIPDYVTFSATVHLSQVPRFPLTTKCLTSLHGCRNAAEVLPWVNWPSQAAAGE